MKKIYIILLCLTALLTACASPGHRMLTDYLGKGAGVLTYKEAVKRWNSPEKVTEGEETFTAVWVDEDYYLIETPGSRFRTPTLTGRRTILTFDKKTNLLKTYRVEYY